MSWQDAWREGRTGWDAGESPPILRRLVERGELPEGLAIVPGCGSGYDVFTLAHPDRRVIGIDIAPVAAERFESLREERGIPSELARIHVGDFFAFDPGERASLFWDYTFFCALAPERRRDWGAKVDSLLASDAELLTLVFPTADIHSREGPPYTVSVDLYQDALGPRWQPHVVRELDKSHPGREGLETLVRWKRG
jgi:hypothetical protein